jgi:hypothetical protein
LVHFNESSLFTDKPENHVNLRTTEEQILQIKSSRPTRENPE